MQLGLLVESVALLADEIQLVERHLVEHAATLEAQERALRLHRVVHHSVIRVGAQQLTTGTVHQLSTRGAHQLSMRGVRQGEQRGHGDQETAQQRENHSEGGGRGVIRGNSGRTSWVEGVTSETATGGPCSETPRAPSGLWTAADRQQVARPQ